MTEVSLSSLIRVAGLVHLAIVAANFVLPRKLPLREELGRLSPMLRQIFVVHWGYILYVVLLFAALCLLFPQELAGATPLGRFLSATIALFWLSRAVLQVFYYDAAFRRQNRALDALYITALIALGAVFTVAAMGWGG